MAPKSLTAAWSAWATEATAIESVWTSMPIESVLDCGLADLRVRVSVVASYGSGVLQAHLTVEPEVSFSSRKALCLYSELYSGEFHAYRGNTRAPHTA